MKWGCSRRGMRGRWMDRPACEGNGGGRGGGAAGRGKRGMDCGEGWHRDEGSNAGRGRKEEVVVTEVVGWAQVVDGWPTV
jgi:hypothetical protein